MADQYYRSRAIRPVCRSEQVGGAGANPELCLDLDRQAQHLCGLPGAPGWTRQQHGFSQWLPAKPLGHVLSLTESLLRELPLGVGDGAVGFLCFSMTPQYQIHVVLRPGEAARLRYGCDEDMTGHRMANGDSMSIRHYGGALG